MSISGVFAQTDQTFPLNTSCVANIFLSGGIEEIRLEIRGRIVRQTNAGIGVHFESMDVETYTHLRNIVQYNSAEAS